jgi:1-acyl-sn-glycerol-3-phosphate acyltransferase
LKAWKLPINEKTVGTTAAKLALDSSGKRRGPGRQTKEPYVLPQWAFDAIRAGFRPVSRLLWGIEFYGAENVPQSGGVIIAANHQTYLDPFWIALKVPRPQRYLAWNEAFSWPIVGPLIGALGAWPLSLETVDPAPLRRAFKWLRKDGALVIFPEGGRCLSDGELMRFKSGAVRLALEARVPILPVTIRGANRVWPRDYGFPRLGKIEIAYHPLMFPQPGRGEDSRACALRETERLQQIIASAL